MNRARFALASLAAAAVVTLGACTAAQVQRVQAVTAQAVQDGQLFCQAAGTLFQAGTVRVSGATATSVADACAALVVAGRAIAAVPVPAAPGQTAVVAAVPAPVAAAVAASAAPTT